MQAFYTGGYIADLMIGCIVLEMLALALRRPRMLRSALPGLCAGIAVALALRCALTGAPWPWLVLFFAAAGVAHGFDVVRRWRI
jgi:hypothetical protein